jgi:hypothetical protein
VTPRGRMASYSGCTAMLVEGIRRAATLELGRRRPEPRDRLHKPCGPPGLTAAVQGLMGRTRR